MGHQAEHPARGVADARDVADGAVGVGGVSDLALTCSDVGQGDLSGAAEALEGGLVGHGEAPLAVGHGARHAVPGAEGVGEPEARLSWTSRSTQRHS